MESNQQAVTNAVLEAIHTTMRDAVLFDEVSRTLNDYLSQNKGISIHELVHGFWTVIDRRANIARNHLFDHVNYTACLEFALDYKRKDE